MTFVEATRNAFENEKKRKQNKGQNKDSNNK